QDCNIISDSNAADSFDLGGSAVVTVPCVGSYGGADVTATLNLTLCTSVNTHMPQRAPDPYADVPDPTVPGPCTNLANNATPLPGVCYNGNSVNFQSTMTLQPGTYYFSGGNVQSNAQANVTGNGVTFVFTNDATFHFNGGSTWNLTAPTTGD